MRLPVGAISLSGPQGAPASATSTAASLHAPQAAGFSASGLQPPTQGGATASATATGEVSPSPRHGSLQDLEDVLEILERHAFPCSSRQMTASASAGGSGVPPQPCGTSGSGYTQGAYGSSGGYGAASSSTQSTTSSSASGGGVLQPTYDPSSRGFLDYELSVPTGYGVPGSSTQSTTSAGSEGKDSQPEGQGASGSGNMPGAGPSTSGD
ncbi:hypothetical protein TGARI_294990 [Toxoplasma gondii ARI]|uniref:Uncharacterized protein n=3 Tax=Toxoplasma gondii TaxID=5811 RepID=A0A2G8XT34_TOXGO|nr:hypothetical protein TGVAND_294990 [Toxoplasma gondii VAND]KYF39648.1 hypothetical protein TGARI_294990 [Toxoplasma gondii ARI]PIL97838.1 hypothetical protein TGCOUG_294990 [Toxoplasma gondii COUG]